MPSSQSKKRRTTKSAITEQILQQELPLEKRKNPIVKISIAGLGGVGKTSLCQRAMGHILDDYFNTYKITIGVQFFTHTVKTSIGNVVMSVWDLAGQPQFHQIMDRFLAGSKGIILAFDCTAIDSFFSLYHFWIPLIKEHCEENIPILLVSTKNDLIENKQVDTTLVQEFINSKEDYKLNIIGFLETSSKDNKNVKETFETLCQTIIKNDNLSFKRNN
ncbi:MAG: Rab family GTPase [Candidatus Thorarchaeota archaeon]